MTPYGFIYLTTNLLNGKKYLGQARYRENLSKNYLGSGNEIRAAIKKYGCKVFSRETVFEAFTFDDLNWAEVFFIAEANAVKSRQWYNISPGGRASLGFVGKKHSAERNKVLSEQMLAEHPRATEVIINGETYNSIHKAWKATGFSRGRIEKFLKTNVHPRDQVHGLKGRKRVPHYGRALTRP